MAIATRIKILIVGKPCTLDSLLRASIAAKAAPAIHRVIVDECIRLGVGRRDYRKVVVPLFNRIRDAIKWKDVKGAVFCPQWEIIKPKVYAKVGNGPNKGLNTFKPDWGGGKHGCVWTDLSLYLAERLIAYRSKLPSTYQQHLQTIARRVAMVERVLPGMGAAIRVPIDLQDGSKLLLVVMADGALLYRRAKIKVAMSQTEVTATVLNEGVQSAHAQIPFLMWASGDDLNSHMQNAGYDLIQKYTTNEFVVRMPAAYPGARTRMAKVVSLVGDSKWIWSVFGVIQNWTRPVATGPFTREQINVPGVHAPVVYDREFYRDIFRQYADILLRSRSVKTVLVPYGPCTTPGADNDPRRERQHFEKFCADELGFDVNKISNFAVHFGWEGAWVGPLHVVGTATKNTYSQWLTIFHTLGLRDKFEEYLLGFKIDVRTIVRSCKGGEKLVAASVWADAGDFIDAVTRSHLFPIKHPDTMSESELEQAYDEFLRGVPRQERTHEKLIKAVADRDGVPVELMTILLMCEHLYGVLCKTIWSKDESWEAYLERVRNYDPTGVTFKRIHFALLFGHGLGTTSDEDGSRYHMRPAPSQLNLIHGQSVPLQRLAAAGLRMINVNEAHLEHRHMIRKAFINLNCVHQFAKNLGKKKNQDDQEKVTCDQIRRGENLLAQQKLQLSKMWFASKDSFAKNTWAARYHKQVIEGRGYAVMYICHNHSRTHSSL